MVQKPKNEIQTVGLLPYLLSVGRCRTGTTKTSSYLPRDVTEVDEGEEGILLCSFLRPLGFCFEFLQELSRNPKLWKCYVSILIGLEDFRGTEVSSLVRDRRFGTHVSDSRAAPVLRTQV